MILQYIPDIKGKQQEKALKDKNYLSCFHLFAFGLDNIDQACVLKKYSQVAQKRTTAL